MNTVLLQYVTEAMSNIAIKHIHETSDCIFTSGLHWRSNKTLQAWASFEWAITNRKGPIFFYTIYNIYSETTRYFWEISCESQVCGSICGIVSYTFQKKPRSPQVNFSNIDCTITVTVCVVSVVSNVKGVNVQLHIPLLGSMSHSLKWILMSLWVIIVSAHQ